MEGMAPENVFRDVKPSGGIAEKVEEPRPHPHLQVTELPMVMGLRGQLAFHD